MRDPCRGGELGLGVEEGGRPSKSGTLGRGLPPPPPTLPASPTTGTVGLVEKGSPFGPLESGEG